MPISGIDKRSTRPNHSYTQVVHITPPIRYPNRPLNKQPAAASNKIEVFAQPPPTILGSFSEFGHATIEAREPAHTLNFRPSYNFDRHYEETNDRRFQQNEYHEPEEQKPPAIVVFNAQQRHPQNYHKLSPQSALPPPPPPPPQFYQNFQYHNINNNHNDNHYNNVPKNFGFKEPPTVQEPPKRQLTPYFVSNDHIFPRPQSNNKQVYAEQRPKPYLVTPASEQIQQQQSQQIQQKKQQQQLPFKASTEIVSSGFSQKYPGHVENQNLYSQISDFARPFEQTNDHNVFIKPNQYVHNLNVGTEVRFGQEHSSGLSTRPVTVELPSTSYTHPATRPFSKFQTPSPKNEELYRIYPVKEVNALPSFLPTPISLGLGERLQPVQDGRPKTPYFKEIISTGGSSEYDAREEQDENESSEQYDIMKSPTKPMLTTTTTTTTTSTTASPSRLTRKKKPSTTRTRTRTTTTSAPEEYEEYVVPNLQQLQLQEQQEYQPQQDYRHQQGYELTTTTTTEAPLNYAVIEDQPVPIQTVNKYKKKKPLPGSRPKEQQHSAVTADEDFPERMTVAPSPITTAVVTTTEAQTTTTTTAAPQSPSTETAVDVRAKTKAKYGNGTRPRFSIKDYKTTTSTSTTSTEKAPSSYLSRRTTTTTPASPTDPETVEQLQQTTGRKPYKPRTRPNRYNKSQSTTAMTTTTTEEQQETVTAAASPYRAKYKPGKYYNRLRTSTTESVTVADDTAGEPVAATEPTRPAVYSAKRRTVPTAKTSVIANEDDNGLRRSSSVSPSEVMDAASSEDVDFIATTVAVTSSSPRHKYHTSYVAERPLLPIESFFQSSMTGKRYHNERR